jgi:hypothetical protein
LLRSKFHLFLTGKRRKVKEKEIFWEIKPPAFLRGVRGGIKDFSSFIKKLPNFGSLELAGHPGH